MVFSRPSLSLLGQLQGGQKMGLEGAALFAYTRALAAGEPAEGVQTAPKAAVAPGAGEVDGADLDLGRVAATNGRSDEYPQALVRDDSPRVEGRARRQKSR